MDPFIHTVIACGTIATAFFVGRYFAGRKHFEDAIVTCLDKLERDGFIATKKDKDGEKDLIPISTIVAKALRDASKVSPKT